MDPHGHGEVRYAGCNGHDAGTAATVVLIPGMAWESLPTKSDMRSDGGNAKTTRGKQNKGGNRYHGRA